MVSQPYTLEKPEILLAGVWGELKTGKTTLGLTFPTPILYIELDAGIERAVRRFLNPPYNYRVEKLNVPVSILKSQQDQGQMTDMPEVYVRNYQIPIRWPGQPLVGFTELWDSITQDIFHFFAMSSFKSCVIDTGTIMWNLCCDSYLQQVQQDKPNRKQLLQIEYRRPNQEMRALLGGFRTYRKNLALLHHEGGIYKDELTSAGTIESVKIGESWGGWGEMGKRVDMVVKTYTAQMEIEKDGNTQQAPRPAAEILKNGYNLDSEGVNLWEPTYDKLIELC